MRRSLLLLSLFLFSATVAQAQSVDPARPFSVIKALQEMGYRAQLEVDSVGDPRIESQLEGVDYYIWFYGCTDNADFTSWKLSVGFDLNSGLNLQKANELNSEKLMGSVYLDDESDPYLEHYIIAKGGVSGALFEEIISRWSYSVSSFKDHINL